MGLPHRRSSAPYTMGHVPERLRHSRGTKARFDKLCACIPSVCVYFISVCRRALFNPRRAPLWDRFCDDGGPHGRACVALCSSRLCIIIGFLFFEASPLKRFVCVFSCLFFHWQILYTEFGIYCFLIRWKFPIKNYLILKASIMLKYPIHVQTWLCWDEHAERPNKHDFLYVYGGYTRHWTHNKIVIEKTSESTFHWPNSWQPCRKAHRPQCTGAIVITTALNIIIALCNM